MFLTCRSHCCDLAVDGAARDLHSALFRVSIAVNEPLDPALPGQPTFELAQLKQPRRLLVLKRQHVECLGLAAVDTVALDQARHQLQRKIHHALHLRIFHVACAQPVPASVSGRRRGGDVWEKQVENDGQKIEKQNSDAMREFGTHLRGRQPGGGGRQEGGARSRQPGTRRAQRSSQTQSTAPARAHSGSCGQSVSEKLSCKVFQKRGHSQLSTFATVGTGPVPCVGRRAGRVAQHALRHDTPLALPHAAPGLEQRLERGKRRPVEQMREVCSVHAHDQRRHCLQPHRHACSSVLKHADQGRVQRLATLLERRFGRRAVLRAGAEHRISRAGGRSEGLETLVADGRGVEERAEHCKALEHGPRQLLLARSQRLQLLTRRVLVLEQPLHALQHLLLAAPAQICLRPHLLVDPLRPQLIFGLPGPLFRRRRRAPLPRVHERLGSQRSLGLLGDDDGAHGRNTEEELCLGDDRKAEVLPAPRVLVLAEPLVRKVALRRHVLSQAASSQGGAVGRGLQRRAPLRARLRLALPQHSAVVQPRQDDRLLHPIAQLRRPDRHLRLQQLFQHPTAPFRRHRQCLLVQHSGSEPSAKRRLSKPAHALLLRLAPPLPAHNLQPPRGPS
eukprot:3863377-Rhodomonas_salina.14